MKNRNIRKAINYAIDRLLYINEFEGRYSTSANNLLPHGVPFKNESLLGYPYNTALANELLDDAGFPRGTNGYRFNLTLVSGPSIAEKLAMISSFLDDIGIQVSIITEDAVTRYLEGDYDILLLTYTSPRDPSLLWNFLHPSSSVNTGGYSNSEINFLLEEGVKTPVKQEREYWYFKLQNM